MVVFMLPYKYMLAIREYQSRDGHSPFSEWHKNLNAEAARKVTTALYRIGLGNVSNVKSVGSGVLECKINFGPGYRVYFGKDAESLVLLLAGGTKHRQEKDIRNAIERWQDHKSRKKLRNEKEEEEE